MAMTDEKRAKFEAGTALLSDVDIRLNIDTDVYGKAPSWKRSLAEQALERRKEDGELSTLRKEVVSLRRANKYQRWGVYAAVVVAGAAIITLVITLFK